MQIDYRKYLKPNALHKLSECGNDLQIFFYTITNTQIILLVQNLFRETWLCKMNQS